MKESKINPQAVHGFLSAVDRVGPRRLEDPNERVLIRQC